VSALRINVSSGGAAGGLGCETLPGVLAVIATRAMVVTDGADAVMASRAGSLVGALAIAAGSGAESPGATPG
jgi:hypothetical protein